MRILVFLSGYIKHGLDSPTAGEGTWGLNLSKMLAQYGHEIDCVANSQGDPPSWGNSTKPTNVTLSYTWDSNKEYDLVLYTPWENLSIRDINGKYGSCLTLPIKAKYFVHCTFGWGDSINDDHECRKLNHVLAYPYIQDEAQFPPYGPRNEFKTFALPIPIAQDFAPINLDKRKDIFWTCKGVFHPDWPEDHYIPPMGIRTLKALKRISDEHNVKIRILDGQYFRESPTSKRLGAMDIVNTIRNVELVDGWIPKKEYLELLGQTRVTITIGGMLGSFAESIFMGSPPLCFQGHIYRAAADKFGIKLDTRLATEEEIYSCIKKLYSDDEFYNDVIKEYRHELRYHQYETVYNNYFLPMISKLRLTI